MGRPLSIVDTQPAVVWFGQRSSGLRSANLLLQYFLGKFPDTGWAAQENHIAAVDIAKSAEPIIWPVGAALVWLTRAQTY
jgi:hypothetical protein